MTITPQIIKDQEFLVKFRGYDTVEVKAYLETIAEEYFKLQEKCRLHDDELADLHKKVSALEANNHSLKTERESSRTQIVETEELRGDVEELQTRIADLEAERTEFDEELSASEARIKDAENKVWQEKKSKENLANKVELLQQQTRDLKKEEVDFKATLASAQKFAKKLKHDSEQKAEDLIASARAEITALRQAAHAELFRLPEEIEELHAKREKAKNELRHILESYSSSLDTFVPADEQQKTSDLFQKIAILEDGSLDPDDLEKSGLDRNSIDEEALFSKGLGSLENPNQEEQDTEQSDHEHASPDQYQGS